MMQSEHKREIGLIAFNYNVLPTQKGDICVFENILYKFYKCAINLPDIQVAIANTYQTNNASERWILGEIKVNSIKMF